MNSLFLLPKVLIISLIALCVNCASLSEICDQFTESSDQIYCHKLITFDYHRADGLQLLDFLNLRHTLRVCSSRPPNMYALPTDLIEINSSTNNSCKLCQSIISNIYQQQFCAKFMFSVRLALHGCDKFDEGHRNDCTAFMKHHLNAITNEFYPTADTVCKKLYSC